MGPLAPPATHFSSLVQTQQEVVLQLVCVSFPQESSKAPLDPRWLSQNASLLFVIKLVLRLSKPSIVTTCNNCLGYSFALKLIPIDLINKIVCLNRTNYI